jgi:hypothetical protein
MLPVQPSHFQQAIDILEAGFGLLDNVTSQQRSVVIKCQLTGYKDEGIGFVAEGKWNSGTVWQHNLFAQRAVTCRHSF